MKSSEPRETLTIGELADRFGLATHVLRHWETMGLLAPVRDPAGRRRYGRVDLYRVAAIQRGKEAGLALDDIRAMIVASKPGTRRAILRHQRDALARRIAQAQVSLTLLECALACEHEDIATCPRFQALLAERSGA